MTRFILWYLRRNMFGEDRRNFILEMIRGEEQLQRNIFFEELLARFMPGYHLHRDPIRRRKAGAQ